MKTARTFIAIRLDEQLHKELEQLQAKLKAAKADVKWVNPKNIHLTLKFLGSITDEQIEKVKNILKTICSRFPTYQIHVAKIGAFPKISYPEVIWAGIDKGVKETIDIYQSIEEEIHNIGFTKENRPFSAHLTLGRVRSPKNKQRLIEIIEKKKDFSSSLEFFAAAITLFKSTLTREGAVYTQLFKGNLTNT